MAEGIVLRELGARRKTHKTSITSKKNHFQQNNLNYISENMSFLKVFVHILVPFGDLQVNL